MKMLGLKSLKNMMRFYSVEQSLIINRELRRFYLADARDIAPVFCLAFASGNK